MLTAVILTKNEENMIIDCVESVLFCDQILIIDDESSDKTVQIVKSMNNPKVHIRVHPVENDFSKQRNYAMAEAKGDWLLFVDADERVTQELQEEITKSISQNSDISGFYIKRSDFVLGKKLEYGEVGNIKLLRLMRKGTGKWKGKVHEVFKTSGKTELLTNALVHYPHKNISSFLIKLNKYSTLRADELYEGKVKSNLAYIILYPLSKFLKNYLFLKGYKDGITGFIHATLMSFHSFLVRGKLYLLWKGIKNI